MEVWKDISGYEGLYQVSNMGRVKSLARKTTHGHRVQERILKPVDSVYLCVTLHKDGRQRRHDIHRLVAKAFIPNPHGYISVNHKDENKHNNSALNLEWCTAAYNTMYGTGHERSREKQSRPVAQYDMEGNFIKWYPSAKEAQRQTGIQQASINQCCNKNKRREKAGGYKWTYYKKEV